MRHRYHFFFDNESLLLDCPFDSHFTAPSAKEMLQKLESCIEIEYNGKPGLDAERFYATTDRGQIASGFIYDRTLKKRYFLDLHPGQYLDNPNRMKILFTGDKELKSEE